MSLESFLNDLKTDISDLFYNILESVVNLGVDVLYSIPVPSFLADLTPLVTSLPSSVLYWIEPMHLGFGLSLIVSALMARMLLRLIPYVGSVF